MDTRELVEAYFRHVNAGEWDRWLELFDEQVVMDDALSPRMEGVEALRASTAAMQQGFKRFNNHLVELLVEGDRAAVICRIDAETAGGGKIDSTGMNFYRVRDGKITYMASFHDSAPFIAAFSGGGGGGEQQPA